MNAILLAVGHAVMTCVLAGAVCHLTSPLLCCCPPAMKRR